MPYSFPGKLVGFPLSNKQWAISVIRGFRNGIITGARIRIPYIIQAALYAIIFQSPAHYGIRGGIECWIAGFVGGYWAFGESKGISGAVNNQIVLYLFARGLEGMSRSFVQRGYLPQTLDVKSPTGFRIFAGFSLALILYMTDYEANLLRPAFVDTMNFLYYDSNNPRDPVIPKLNFLPIVLIVLISLLYPVFPRLELDQILSVLD